MTASVQMIRITVAIFLIIQTKAAHIDIYNENSLQCLHIMKRVETKGDSALKAKIRRKRQKFLGEIVE